MQHKVIVATAAKRNLAGIDIKFPIMEQSLIGPKDCVNESLYF